MRRFSFLIIPLLILVLMACQTAPPRDVQAQAMVDRAKITNEFFKTRNRDSTALYLSTLKDARGIMIFPSYFQAGIGIGGSGGTGVMLVRRADGSWSYPAFYDFGGASLGLQLGAQSTDIAFMLMTDRAVEAVIASSGQIGFDTQATLGQLSAGDVSATTVRGANIIGFTKGSGLYAGASLSGASVTPKHDWNEAYYGKPVTPQEILVDGAVSNSRADPLRESLVVR